MPDAGPLANELAYCGPAVRIGMLLSNLQLRTQFIMVFAFLYVTKIRQLSQYFGGQDATQGWMGNAYLSHSYFMPGKVNPLVFIIGRTVGVFQYVFRQLLVGDIAFILFIVGLVIVFRSRPVSSRVTSPQLGCLLLLPCVFNCAAPLCSDYS